MSNAASHDPSRRRAQVSDTPEAADDAMRDLESAGVSPQSTPVTSTRDAQPGDVMASPSLLSSGQVRGAGSYGAAGALLVGLIGGAVAWFIPLGGYSPWVSAAVVAFIGAMAGGTAGAVYGGSRKPELDHEAVQPDANVRPTTGVKIVAPKQ